MSSTPRNRFVPLGAAALLAFAGSGARAQVLAFHLDGDQGSSSFGQTVSSGFDVDGDGIDDVLVGVPNESGAGGTQEGVVRLYSGATHALLREIWGAPLGSYSSFGYAVALVGDVDGDGTCDLVVGAPAYLSYQGYVAAFSGANGNLLWNIVGGTGEQLGTSVAAAGDVDHDGHMDVIAGAPGGGNVYLYGWGTGALHVWNNSQSGAEFGASVSGNVDVDGDGTMDVIVGAPFYSSVVPFKKFRGRVDGFSGSSYASILGAVGDDAGDHLGIAVCGLGDMNGDGKAEVLAGAPGAASGAGLVREYDGAGTYFPYDFTNSAAPGYGTVVARVRDIDFDGVPDLLIASNPSPTSIVDLFSSSNANSFNLGGYRAFTFLPDADSGGFGFALASGDFDGDGASDVVIGDPYRWINSLSSGGVQVFRTVPATWVTYGAGWPGTLGEPTLKGYGVPGQGPGIGGLCPVSVSNSYGQPTPALLFLGVSTANVQTSKGGTLLVVPAVTIPLALDATGWATLGGLPYDPRLLGVSFYLQVIELDPGASNGVSFTNGLEGDIGIF